MGIDFAASGADDLICGERFLVALFGHRFRIKTTCMADPILIIPAAISEAASPEDSQQRSSTDSAQFWVAH